MNLLDENIVESQRQLLWTWRIRARQIGRDAGRQGMKDPEIIPLLHQLNRTTFFTRDLDFYRRDFCHERYCLVYLDVGQFEVASFVRRLLRHSEFDTWAKRRGTVIRANQRGIRAWRLHGQPEQVTGWARSDSE